jgi:hypothetical protein
MPGFRCTRARNARRWCICAKPRRWWKSVRWPPTRAWRREGRDGRHRAASGIASYRTLALPTVESRLENLLEQPAKNNPGYAYFLLDVLTVDVEARRQRYLKTRRQLAQLPYVKSFEQFDFSFAPSIDERQIRERAT